MARSNSTVSAAKKRGAAAPGTTKTRKRPASASKASGGKSGARKVAVGTSARTTASTRKPTPSRAPARGKTAGAARRATGQPAKSKVARQAKPVRKPAKKALSPEARKQLAGERLRQLLEEKRRLAAQTPAWQRIEHHDHAPRPAAHQPHGGGAPDAEATHNSGHRGDS